MINIPTAHITFGLSKPLTISVNYHHSLQSLVYSLFPQQEAAFIHDQGYQFQDRVYKLFSFSNIQCNETSYDKRTKRITFYNKITISISSILSDLIQKVANQLLLSESCQLNGLKLYVEKVEFNQNHVSSNTIIVKALSPITVYSTYERRDGSKITHYFSPWDKVFEHLIEENFARKYQAFTGNSLSDEKELLSIRPVLVSERNKIITNYKGTWITGWTGIYELKAKAEYLSFVLDTSIGAKNSSGFGFVVPYEQGKK